MNVECTIIFVYLYFWSFFYFYLFSFFITKDSFMCLANCPSESKFDWCKVKITDEYHLHPGSFNFSSLDDQLVFTAIPVNFTAQVRWRRSPHILLYTCLAQCIPWAVLLTLDMTFLLSESLSYDHQTHEGISLCTYRSWITGKVFWRKKKKKKKRKRKRRSKVYVMSTGERETNCTWEIKQVWEGCEWKKSERANNYREVD